MRRRLVVTIAGVAAAAVALFAIPLALVLQRNYRDEALLRLQRDAVAAARGIDLSRNRSDTIELPRTQDQLAVYDRNGHRIAGQGSSVAPPPVRAALRSARPVDSSAGGKLIVAVPILNGERVAGAVQAERDDASAVHDTQQAWLLLAGLGVAIVLAAIVAALVFGRRLAAPLERLAEVARRLGHGDFSARAPHAAIPEADAIASALDATAQRLDELVTRERAFSADASHQLRTPLAALRIELETAALSGHPPPEIERALAQVDRLQSTIDTLLALARDAPRSNATTDLTALLDEVEDRWRGPLAADGRPQRTALRAERPEASAAPEVAREVLEVLLDNARRHGAGAVTVSVRELDGFVAVDVADEGPGFAGDPEEAFARHSGSDHGIGLALARSLAHAEGGRLTASESGQGAVVTLLLRH
jgi:signal transduction histidine kinase